MKSKRIDIKYFLIKYALFILIGCLWIFYGTQSEHFFTVKNLRSLLMNASPLLIYATGMTFILILGEIDLSIGSVGAVSAACWILALTQWNCSLPVAFLIALGIGIACGLVTGFLVVKLRINAFMASLGMMFILRGACYLSVGGEQIITPKVVRNFAKVKILTLSPLVAISLVIAIAMMLIYKYTSFGRKMQATGCDRNAARMVGIKVDRIRYIVFIISGARQHLRGLRIPRHHRLRAGRHLAGRRLRQYHSGHPDRRRILLQHRKRPGTAGSERLSLSGRARYRHLSRHGHRFPEALHRHAEQEVTRRKKT